MTVFVLIREDQSDLGYIDTSIAGIYEDKRIALEQEALQRQKADEEGLLVEDDQSDGDWQVCWFVEEHAVS
jgi:hypothetical protein